MGRKKHRSEDENHEMVQCNIVNKTTNICVRTEWRLSNYHKICE